MCLNSDGIVRASKENCSKNFVASKIFRDHLIFCALMQTLIFIFTKDDFYSVTKLR
jgi:hypothetical protein